MNFKNRHEYIRSINEKITNCMAIFLLFLNLNFFPIRPTSSNVIPSSQSSDNMMVTRNLRAQASVTRPQIPDALSPTSSWNEGCY